MDDLTYALLGVALILFLAIYSAWKSCGTSVRKLQNVLGAAIS